MGGQAFAAGVKSGWVVKTINGQNVAGESFAKIMDMLDDEVMDQRMSQHFYASQKGAAGRPRGHADHRRLPGGCWPGCPVAGNEGGHLGGLHPLSNAGGLLAVAIAAGAFLRSVPTPFLSVSKFLIEDPACPFRVAGRSRLALANSAKLAYGL